MLYSFFRFMKNVGCSSAFRTIYPNIYYRTRFQLVKDLHCDNVKREKRAIALCSSFSALALLLSPYLFVVQSVCKNDEQEEQI